MMTYVRHIAGRTVLIACLLLLIASCLQPLRALADDCNGLSQLDCQAIYGNWANWIPLTGCEAGGGDDGSSADTSTTSGGGTVAAYKNPVYNDGLVADPGVVVGDDGLYHVYSTGGRQLTSSDLVHWKTAKSWNTSSVPNAYAWAPDVAKIGSTYVLTFGDGRGNGAIHYATSSSASGPFKNNGVISLPTAGRQNIDPQIFVDDDGSAWLFYGTLQVKAVKVTLSGSTLKKAGSVKSNVMHISPYPSGYAVEGWWVVKRDGWYYMFYSYGRYTGGNPSYSVRVARSKTVDGPYTPYKSHPILQSNSVNPGHNAVVTDGAGNDWMIYAGYPHNNADSRGMNRRLFIDPISWKNGWPIVNNGNGPSTTQQPGGAASTSTSDTSSAGSGTTCTCGGGDVSLTGGNRVEQAYNFFVSKPGMTAQAAAGLVGNFQAESGKDLDPTAENSIGAYGIAQWLDRRSSLEDYARQHNKPASDFLTQLNYAWAELSGTLPKHAHNYKNSTLIPIEKAKTASDAAYIVYDKYESPGDGSYPTREANATKIFNRYAGGASGGAAVNASDPSATNTSMDCSASSGAYTAGGACTVTAPVTLNQYSQAQLKRIFGDPGTASNHPDLHLTTISFLGHNASVSPLVAPCLKAVSDQLTAEHTTYKIRLFGCYRFDSNNGTTNIGLSSYHTYGAACDINWDTNPIVLSGTAKHDMPQAWIQAFHDHGFTWGGTWHSKKDYMHFEFHGIKP